MKNRKFIAFVMVLSMMLMGAGYAAWTQEFNVTANVETGQLDISLSPLADDVAAAEGDVDIYYVNADKEEVLDENYASGVVVVSETDAYAVDVTLDDMYPGAIAKFDVQVKNTGTVGIKMANIGNAVNVDDETYGTYTIVATNENASAEIGKGETEVISYTVTFIDGENDDSENLTDEVTVSIPVTYMQYNQ